LIKFSKSFDVLEFPTNLEMSKLSIILKQHALGNAHLQNGGL
jgi:hypothetical protein